MKVSSLENIQTHAASRNRLSCGPHDATSQLNTNESCLEALFEHVAGSGGSPSELSPLSSMFLTHRHAPSLTQGCLYHGNPAVIP